MAPEIWMSPTEKTVLNEHWRDQGKRFGLFIPFLLHFSLHCSSLAQFQGANATP